MKSLSDLTASDFPGVEPVRFDEWKKSVRNANRSKTILGVGLLLSNIILFLATGRLFSGGLLLLLVLFVIDRRPKRLAKELGIDRAGVKRARSQKPPVLDAGEMRTGRSRA